MNCKNIKAVILAGGLGTRLRPIISEVPKPMTPILGKPFLEYLVEYVKKRGIQEIVLCVSYMKEMIIDYFKDGQKLGVKIEYGIEEEPLGTGGAIKNIERIVSNAFLVMNGDTFPLFDISDLLEFYRRKQHVCSGIIALSHHPEIADKGNVTIASDGRIVNFDEKIVSGDKASLVNSGIYLFNKTILSMNIWKKKCSLESDVFPKLIAKGYILGINMKGSFLDIGLPGGYKKVKELIGILSE